jgi:hypothetical protein
MFPAVQQKVSIRSEEAMLRDSSIQYMELPSRVPKWHQGSKWKPVPHDTAVERNENGNGINFYTNVALFQRQWGNSRQGKRKNTWCCVRNVARWKARDNFCETHPPLTPYLVSIVALSYRSCRVSILVPYIPIKRILYRRGAQNTNTFF